MIPSNSANKMIRFNFFGKETESRDNGHCEGHGRVPILYLQGDQCNVGCLLESASSHGARDVTR